MLIMMATSLLFGIAVQGARPDASICATKVHSHEGESLVDVSNETSFVELVSFKEHLGTERAIPYEYVRAASSPASTCCSWLWKSERSFYRRVGNVCGIRGTNQDAINDHVGKVWKLIMKAYSEMGGNAGHKKQGDTLRIFLMPEWALGRRYPADGTDFSPPLNFAEMQYIVSSLENNMQKSSLDFSDWLIVPGSIYWGFQISHPVFDSIKGYFGSEKFDFRNKDYAVFNTAPVYYGGKLVWAHNKYNVFDNCHPSEAWGYDLVQAFAEGPDCTKYDEGGARICGSTEFVKKMTIAYNNHAGIALQKWGLQQPAYAILVNGLAVGLDICADHNYKDSHAASFRVTNLKWIDMFDIQLLIASGMSFDIPPEKDERLALTLRTGGLAISSDGIRGLHNATRLFRAHTDIISQPSKLEPDLLNDFKEFPPRLVGSWTDGCAQPWMDDLNKDLCTLCTARNQFASDSQANNPGWVDKFCDTQAGNFNILKVWDYWFGLPQFRSEEYQKSAGKAAVYNNVGLLSAPEETGKKTSGYVFSNAGQQATVNTYNYYTRNHPDCGECSHGCLGSGGVCYNNVLTKALCGEIASNGHPAIWCPF